MLDHACRREEQAPDLACCLLLRQAGRSRSMGRVRTKNDAVGTIFEVLMTEHRDVEVLFDQIEAMITADDTEAANDLFSVLMASLLAHAKVEDSVAYARFEEIRELQERVREAR